MSPCKYWAHICSSGGFPGASSRSQAVGSIEPTVSALSAASLCSNVHCNANKRYLKRTEAIERNIWGKKNVRTALILFELLLRTAINNSAQWTMQIIANATSVNNKKGATLAIIKAGPVTCYMKRRIKVNFLEYIFLHLSTWMCLTDVFIRCNYHSLQAQL